MTKTFTNNGLVNTEADANNNLSTFTYDGFDRLSQLTFPSPTTHGISNGADYESYGYDANDNRTSLRRRSGGMDLIGFSYDAVNRVSQKTVPSWSGQNVSYNYDLLNRLTAVAYASGGGVSYGYDALGRKVSETAGGRTIGSGYDLAGDRTRITWPDGLYVTYGFDALQHPTQALLGGSVGLATYNWNALDLLVGDGVSTFALSRGNGAKTNITYDGAWRVGSFSHAFANSSANETWTFAYNPANQIVSRAATNYAYESYPAAGSVAYAPNGLNQYASVGGMGYGYDGRGNMTSDGTRAFTYDIDNQLLTASAPTPATLAYDPTLRLQTSTAGGATTTFLYDGPNLAAEYNGAGSVLRRYVPSGLGGDTPLLWYEGATTAAPRWLHADYQGSIVAYSDGSGTEGLSTPYGYGPYGEPDAANGWTGSRYRYTGQVMIPEAHLYYYKARVYDPGLGRFLQTDPVGYKDDLDLYAYVGDDPVDKTDPTGQFAGVDDAAEATAAVVAVGILAVGAYENGQCSGAGGCIGVAAGQVGDFVGGLFHHDGPQGPQTSEARSKPGGPDPDADGRGHSIPDGKGGYTTYGPRDPVTGQPESTKQYRPAPGAPHGPIQRPNVKDRPANTRPDGARVPGKPVVRPPQPGEAPQPPPPPPPPKPPGT